MTRYRHKDLSLVCCTAGVTLAAVAVVYDLRDWKLAATAAIFVVLGIITADLRGPRDPD